MAYTVSTSKQSTPFGSAVADGNRVALTNFPNQFLTIDATGTPLTSPLTVNTTATLVVPLNAVSFTVLSTTNAVTVSEDSTSSASFSIPAGQQATLPCARQANIYLKAGVSTVVNFFFSCY
jgi:hypothetical protein